MELANRDSENALANSLATVRDFLGVLVPFSRNLKPTRQHLVDCSMRSQGGSKMGLRGPGVKPLLARREALETATSQVYPWEAPDLTRADRVIASSGKAANQKLRLRSWQRKFVKAVYREDKRGVCLQIHYSVGWAAPAGPA